MKILITGANGLLGSKLVHLLISQKEEVIATSRGSSRFKNSTGLIYQSMDITDPEQVSKVLNLTKPDVIINTAAMTQVDDCETDRDLCWKMNVKGVQILVDEAEKIGAHLIHISTDFIFSGDKGPLVESDIPKPVNFYGESKLRSEEIVMNSQLDWTIARTVLVYGITQDMSRSNIILWVKSKLENKEKINVVNDQFRTPTLAEDLAMGCYLIAKNRATGIYNISGKDFLSPYEMAIKTADFFNLDKSLITEIDSTKFTQPAKRPLITGFNIEKAKKELGYSPLSFEEGIKKVSEDIKKRT